MCVLTMSKKLSFTKVKLIKGLILTGMALNLGMEISIQLIMITINCYDFIKYMRDARFIDTETVTLNSAMF